MTTMLVVAAVAIAVLVGMWFEYHTGRFDHFMCRYTRPKFPTPQPVLSEEFIDDREQFNRAMIKTPMSQRVFEEKETLQ
jgi:hypothetical protein